MVNIEDKRGKVRPEVGFGLMLESERAEGLGEVARGHGRTDPTDRPNGQTKQNNQKRQQKNERGRYASFQFAHLLLEGLVGLVVEAQDKRGSVSHNGLDKVTVETFRTHGIGTSIGKNGDGITGLHKARNILKKKRAGSVSFRSRDFGPAHFAKLM